MRASFLFSIASAAALWLVQGCATAPRITALDLRAIGDGKCLALDKAFACDDVVHALTDAGVPRTAAIQIQFLPGPNVGEAARLLHKLRETLAAAGYTGVSKSAVVVAPDVPLMPR
jgi:hypothetical protein